MNVDQTGMCGCGAVTFKVTGPLIMNAFCHCKVCSRAYAVSPVHLVAVPTDAFTFTNDSEKNSEIRTDKIVFCHCKRCGVNVYQHPLSKPFTVVLPTNFRIEQGDVGQMLPEELKPTMHINYENRQWDHADDLPKFKTFPSAGVVMNNDGSVKET